MCSAITVATVKVIYVFDSSDTDLAAVYSAVKKQDATYEQLALTLKKSKQVVFLPAKLNYSFLNTVDSDTLAISSLYYPQS